MEQDILYLRDIFKTLTVKNSIGKDLESSLYHTVYLSICAFMPYVAKCAGYSYPLTIRREDLQDLEVNYYAQKSSPQQLIFLQTIILYFQLQDLLGVSGDKAP